MNEYRPCICIDSKNTYIHGYIKCETITKDRKITLKNGEMIKVVSGGIPVKYIEAVESGYNILT